ncbi:MAG TPA: DUF4124 domain-containing protein [Gammaproteobacteria bacterium]|nr:DUF4124 domain-containing protein [Gammaproteobacteria bacterium]
MRKWLILLLTLSMNAAGAASAWTWTDSNGIVHYSDTPVPGARQIELGSAQGFGPSQGGSARRAAQAPAPASTEQSASAQPYRSVSVVSPTDQQTLWNLGGSLDVQIATDPSLRPGDRVDVLLDGQRRNLNSVSPQLTLAEVFRGVHTLVAVVIDASGREVARSSSTTFIVQQTSVANPK